MKVKRKAVSNKTAIDIPTQASQPLDSESLCGDEVSTSSSVNGLGVRHVSHDGIVPVPFPVVSTCIENNVGSSPTFCGSAVGSSSRDISTVEIGQGGGHYVAAKAAHNLHLNDHNNGPAPVPFPVVFAGIQSTVASSSTFCGVAVGSSSRGISTMEIGDEGGGYAVVNAAQNLHSNKGCLSGPGLPCQMDLPHGVPVQVPTVDGSVSTFEIANIVRPFYVAARQPAITEVVGQPSVYNVGVAGHVPMVLDFSAGHVICGPNLSACQLNNHMNAPQIGIPARTRRQAGQPHMRNPDAPPVQGPIAPPQREEGLVDFLDHNNALVRLFRTARDKLRESDIPNFSIRLFGVVGVSQYELPTAESIGAIVYEGGPETMTDYDVVIEHHSGEPERKMSLTVNADASSTSTGTSIIPSRQFAYLTELNPTDNSKFIEVRVYRKWTAVKVPSFAPMGFSCILLDKKDSWGKTLDNDFTLCFGKYTQIDLLQDNDFPYHYFNFAAFNELNARLEKKNPILTAICPTRLHWICAQRGKVKEYGAVTSNRVKVRNIGIRNLNILTYNNVVLFTLWNEDADNFEEDEYAQMKQPVILAVSSCYLKRYAGQIQLSATLATRYYFNPDVQEIGELLAAYNETNTAPVQLEVQTERLTNWEQERNRNRVPLATLLQIDPKTQQRVLFTQEAMILQTDTGHDWYYQKCDECGGKLRYGYLHGQCHQYGTKPNPENSYCFRMIITDGTGNATMSCFTPQTDGLIKDITTLLQEVEVKNPATIPAAILALQNTRHVFQFQFATPTIKGPPTFVLKKMMDNPPSALPETSAGPSSPPTVTTVSHTDEESTPPPVTPTVTQDTPMDTPAITSRPL
ncbi:hypothetical protein CTI12_AA577260 [Artemisia annua]|uniref:Nucleic acid-binding, OB-fold protein n=1 Tax=Artemisia annua TaxID=35608 RepID=A0A2U1KQI0_ARTAN|nr:hypothetical protein CTI12_AA577260 [Artemisia annua]